MTPHLSIFRLTPLFSTTQHRLAKRASLIMDFGNLKVLIVQCKLLYVLVEFFFATVVEIFFLNDHDQYVEIELCP